MMAGVTYGGEPACRKKLGWGRRTAIPVKSISALVAREIMVLPSLQGNAAGVTEAELPAKGQVTSSGGDPSQIRGYVAGDRVEFREHEIEAVITRAMEPGNPFDRIHRQYLRGKQKLGMHFEGVHGEVAR